MRYEWDEGYDGSLQQLRDMAEDHALMLGLDMPEKQTNNVVPMTREKYLESLRKRFPLSY